MTKPAIAVVTLERPRVRHHQRPRRDRLVPAAEFTAVDERVGERHNDAVHPILLGEVDDRLRVRLGQATEERDVEPALARGRVADERRELVVIADEDELAGEAQRAEAGRQGDLRGLVDDAVVECALAEERAAVVNLTLRFHSTH